MNNQIGEKLKAYRLTVFPNDGLRRVAKALEIDFTLLSKVETGTQRPSDETLEAMVRVYKIPPQEAFYLFSLAHATDEYRKAAEQAQKDRPRAYQQAFSHAFFRTAKDAGDRRTKHKNG